MTNTNQMELGFDRQQNIVNATANSKARGSRAQWWFTQMRRVVDMATDWKPTPQGRPEQVYMTLNVR